MRARLAVDVREDADPSGFFLLCELDVAADVAAFSADATCAGALAAGVGALAGFEVPSGCEFETCAC